MILYQNLFPERENNVSTLCCWFFFIDFVIKDCTLATPTF
jgi:hypothetical protein